MNYDRRHFPIHMPISFHTRSKQPWLINIALAMLYLVSILGMLGQLSWVFDLFSHFRVQYSALFTVIGCYALIRRHWQPGLAAAIGLAFNGVPIAAQMIQPATADPTNQLSQVRIVSFNVFDKHTSIERLAAFLEETTADVAVLQEFDLDNLSALQQELASFPYVAARAGGKNYGTVILSRWPVVDEQPVQLAGNENLAATAVIDVRGRKLSVFGVHLHWPILRQSAALRNIELGNLAAALEQCTELCIAVGDFNLTPWSPHYAAFVRRSNATDCARGHGLLPTWPTFFWPLAIRIDHCFVKGAISIRAVQTGPKLGSDHVPTITDLVLQNPPFHGRQPLLSIIPAL